MTYSPATITDGLTLAQAYAILRRHRLVVIGLPLLSAAVVGGWLAWAPPSFVASTTFVVDASRQPQLPGGLAGLAGQLGMTLGTDGTESPQFYAAIMTSQALLRRALTDIFPSTGSDGPDSMRLVDLLDLDEAQDSSRLRAGTELLAGRIATRVDGRTGLVEVSVTAKSATLATAIASRLPRYLNDFNARSRNSRARARRAFVEEQIVAAERDLTAAEERLERFYEQNRSWEGSPQLRFQEGRLRRQIDIAQEVFLTLKREYETARIEEVNDVPVITVVDPPLSTTRVPTPLQRVLYVMGGVAGGFAVAVLVAFGLEFWHTVRYAQKLPRSPALPT